MSLEEMLKSLQRDYVAGIPGKIDVIRTQMRAESATGLRECFHKLKGTGRTYGLPEISELGEVVERICISSPKDAVSAAGHAVLILQDIFSSRNAEITYNLHSDPRFEQIRRLTPT